MTARPSLIAALAVALMALAASQCHADDLSDLAARVATLPHVRAAKAQPDAGSFIICYPRKAGETVMRCELVQWRGPTRIHVIVDME